MTLSDGAVNPPSSSALQDSPSSQPAVLTEVQAIIQANHVDTTNEPEASLTPFLGPTPDAWAASMTQMANMAVAIKTMQVSLALLTGMAQPCLQPHSAIRA